MTYKIRLKKYGMEYIIFFALVIIVMTSFIYSGLKKYSESENRLELLNSSEKNIERLVQKSKEYPKINQILSNVNLYPMSLIDLAAKNFEAIDFVVDYPKHKKTTSTDYISIKEDYKKGEIPLFMQWDKRWGYDKYGDEFIAVNGCGPTSLAMVAVGLTGNIDVNPKVVADYSRDKGYLVNGVGTKWSLMTEGANHFGLLGTEIKPNENIIISNLKKGYPIIASMGPGEFTRKGHFIVLKGIDENGKVIVNDPNSKVRSEKVWDIEVFMKEAKNLWAFKAVK